MPMVSAKGEQLLAENMVVTIEPGIYLPGRCGVRIEDDVAITATGCKVLTSAPRELIIV
jgi:Xaa-Pro aminopeptidase